MVTDRRSMKLLENLTCLLPFPGGSAAFLSRTGKTTDVTQIKGWREKFTLPEAPPIPASSTPEGHLHFSVPHSDNVTGATNQETFKPDRKFIQVKTSLYQ